MIFRNCFFYMAAFVMGLTGPLIAQERGSSAPFVSGDTFRAHVDHIFDETTQSLDPRKVKPRDVVFVKTDYIGTFFRDYYSHIEHPFILVTHNSDDGAPGPFKRFLDDPKLLAWFAQNVEEAHPKLHPIPIGIANRCWSHGNPHTFAAFLPAANNHDRPYLCCVNFHPSTYPKERTLVWRLFAKQPWTISYLPSKNLANYLEDLSRSKFVLSPRGNGLDAHRTWEALLMGAIPVVRSSTLDPMFEDLPVLIVQNWEEVTESYLNEQYEKIKSKPYNHAKLFSEYWIARLRE